MKKLKILLLIPIIAISMACGNDDGSAPGFQDYSYGGSGSFYNLQLRANGTFTITVSATNGGTATTTVEGTYVRSKSGFNVMTVTGGSGTDVPTTGSQAYGLEVPGMVFLLKPLDEGDIIPMVQLAGCRDSDFSGNWITTKLNTGNAANNASMDLYGTFSFTAATGAGTLPSRYSLTYASLGSNPIATSSSCSGGIIEVSGATMWGTPSGAFIVNADNTIITMPPTDSPIAAADLNGNYAGVVFDGNGATGSKNFPVNISLANGVGTGTQVTNVETGATSSDTVTINLNSFNVENNGFIRATITDPSGTANMICMASLNVVGDKDTFMCAGQSPGNNTELFSVLATSI